MGTDFFDHLVDQARYGQPTPAHSADQDQQDTAMQPPITCPLCYSLVLEQAFKLHSEWHQRTGQ